MQPVEPTPKAIELLLRDLHLDPLNPRLPEELQESDEQTLLEYIAEAYSAIEVARSVARYGYFQSEPLIAVWENDRYVVVEGNRRLVALRILANPALARDLDRADEWAELAKTERAPEEVPVIVAEDRKAVAPIIGYRHISGIEPWKPYQKARFIARFINEDQLSIDDVAILVGERPTDVAGHYRNHEIVSQARDKLHLDTSRVVGKFGVFTRAMSSQPLRQHIEAPTSAEVMSGQPVVLPDDKAENAKELFSWLFGDEDDDQVISESRDITRLGTVVGSEEGLKVLRPTRNLEAADQAAGGPRRRLLNRLTQVRGSLSGARSEISGFVDDEEVQALLHDIKEELDELLDMRLDA